jgi:hypothetical protein
MVKSWLDNRELVAFSIAAGFIPGIFSHLPVRQQATNN